MSSILLLLAPLLLAPAGAGRAAPVRIGVFDLFKPQVVHARIASGESALLDCALAGRGAVAPGETIRIVLSSGQLDISITDRFGRIRRSFAATETRMIPEGAATLELILPGKIKREMRGEITIAPSTGAARRSLKIIVAVDREAAVASICAAEAGNNREPELLKAMAVVVRTYMISHGARHDSEGFDFCDTTHCQLYRGEQDLTAEAASPTVAAAVGETAGEHLGFADRAIESYYTAVCGGLTVTPRMVWGGADSHYNYRSVACRWCASSPFMNWRRSAAVSSILSALSPLAGWDLSLATELDTRRDEASGFVQAVFIRDGEREREVSGDELRRAIGKRLGWSTVLSPTFNIERRAGRFYFSGKGFGSQVGLCVAGAAAQAKAGRDYKKILGFYYPGAEIRK
jgi:stage II sporulation protein D